MNRKRFLVSLFLVLFVLPGFVLATARTSKVSRSPTKTKWKYIIIHHSATKNGSASVFDKYHRRRGMKNGLAYHFVIDNGTCGKRDGQLEIGSRWKKGLSAGGCRQDYFNRVGIHICLVGDYNKKRPTRKQKRTLVNLVNELQKKYNIQTKNVVGHGKIKGEKSQCPGKYFPWSDFKKQLKATK